VALEGAPSLKIDKEIGEAPCDPDPLPPPALITSEPPPPLAPFVSEAGPTVFHSVQQLAKYWIFKYKRF
jgi:hypothetical protein